MGSDARGSKMILPKGESKLVQPAFINTLFVGKSTEEIYNNIYNEIISIVCTKITFSGKLNAVVRSLITLRHKSIYDIVYMTEDQLRDIYTISEFDYKQFMEIQKSLKEFYNVPNYTHYEKL